MRWSEHAHASIQPQRAWEGGARYLPHGCTWLIPLFNGHPPLSVAADSSAVVGIRNVGPVPPLGPGRHIPSASVGDQRMTPSRPSIKQSIQLRRIMAQSGLSVECAMLESIRLSMDAERWTLTGNDAD